jgi:hypothetical protein
MLGVMISESVAVSLPINLMPKTVAHIRPSWPPSESEPMCVMTMLAWLVKGDI